MDQIKGTEQAVSKQQQKTQIEHVSEPSLALDVSASALGKKWILREGDMRTAEAISQRHYLPDIVGQIISKRDIDLDKIADFLEPSLKTQLPNPSILQDMDIAAEHLAQAVMDGDKIAVFGDYDVDGATSTALFKRFFQMIGHDITVYIPDRLKEGYGPNETALLKLGEEGHKTIVTVDCGATAFEPIEAATNAGIEMIIFDHHACELTLPKAKAVINPNRLDDTSDLGHLAAVGVVFLAIVAINRCLRQHGYYTSRQIAEPKLHLLLDIVALGTICDVVPLKTINRTFVTQGLKIMAMRQNMGIKALSDIAGIDEMPDTFHAGFILGPRINAGGRVGEANLGSELLSTSDAYFANQIAVKLQQYNKERQDIEMQVLEQAIAQVESEADLENDYVIIAHGDNWHPGVIGIVASRLKEKYNRPACVIGFDDQGVGKASGRSVAGIDLGALVIAARQNEILEAGGGHKMAAGFTIAKTQLDAFKEFLNTRLAQQLEGQKIVPELNIDAIVTPNSLTIDLCRKMSVIAPFGQGNSEPRLAVMSARLMKVTTMGADHTHIRCLIQDTAGGAAIGGVAFKVVDSDLGHLLLNANDRIVHLAGYLRINKWNGFEKPQFQIVDADFA